MIIQDSSVHLSSQHLSVEEYHKKESLTYWQKGNTLQAQAGKDDSKINMTPSSSSVKVSLSSAAMQKTAEELSSSLEEDEMMGDLNIRILRDLIERITGRKIKLFKHDNREGNHQYEGERQHDRFTQKQNEAQNFGLEYEKRESYMESEATSFSASGKIITTDGEEVNFSLSLNMSREFYQENNISLKMGDALKDPLVVNFEGTAANLTTTKFLFDIDADGTEESISFVTPESGFLAIDRNNDGEIDDGTELFGALTGNGFIELGQHDDDKNGWIDENDTIYDKLQIWLKDSAGKDTLIAIGKKGIGAIYLGNISTPFDVKTTENDQLGVIRSSSIFLREDFTPGTIQQVDMIV